MLITFLLRCEIEESEPSVGGRRTRRRRDRTITGLESERTGERERERVCVANDERQGDEGRGYVQTTTGGIPAGGSAEVHG